MFSYEKEILDKLNSQFNSVFASTLTMFAAGPETLESATGISILFPVPGASKSDFNVLMTAGKFLKVVYRPKTNNKFVLPFTTTYDFRNYDENTISVSLDSGILTISANKEDKKKAPATRVYEVS